MTEQTEREAWTKEAMKLAMEMAVLYRRAPPSLPGNCLEAYDQKKSALLAHLRTAALAVPQQQPVATTPAAVWRDNCEPDPHGNRYDCERAALCMGDLSDDELANGAFLNYDQPLNIEAVMASKPDYHPPIAWMTAVKDRIRWLSRKLEESRAAPPAVPMVMLTEEELDACRDVYDVQRAVIKKNGATVEAA